jgi:glycosyltransferase involved in cell wall biosynthesis
MPLTVLNVAFPFAPVGPFAVGGAEQVLTWIDAALVTAGHHSIVLAPDGSQVAGELWSVPAVTVRYLDMNVRTAIYEAQRSRLREILEHRPVDLVHMHGIDFLSYLPARGVTVLVTLHLPIAWYSGTIFSIPRPNTFLHCVSRTQQESAPAEACLLPPIGNGVATEALAPVRYRGRPFAAALGRICPEKGFHFAIDAAKGARIALLLAGKLFFYPEHTRYFDEEIVPRLDGMRRFVGAIGPLGKRRLLGSALCLLVPSLAPETSSLVVMEALSCGTPVVAFRSGALTEIVEHGKTGFLVQDEKEMAHAIAAVTDLDPDVCRETARRRFSVGRMTAAYLELYAHLAGKSEGNSMPEITTAEHVDA